MESSHDHDPHHRFLRKFTAHEQAIRAYIRRLVPSRADADDVMQETAVVLWEKFGEFREDGEFRAWAFGVAKFKVLSWMRDKGRERVVLAPDVIEMVADESARDESRWQQQREALESCTEKLPPAQRDLLMASYQPEARIQDVATASGRTVAGFYQWLYRIRRSLLECVQREILRQGSP